ncbi:PREDICTED: histone-lysine N-methyltransferase, H3 lysine-9 specific SUVH6-like isoform X1 [Camelina sativa]|uniref:Histone-lysine N-methyltransferase, H3 lysine-9 specific SUVH6-like isoform X1 n=2 Tax=Camelina sativa TaxID=90675 RepID=A0ABM0WK78_CAMSA|nr:PREDICTED: histone-lysine N-methyltransferase, H3 lysine-9 specific SUVH6-like isoform X1 [Camelina sativa]
MGVMENSMVNTETTSKVVKVTMSSNVGDAFVDKRVVFQNGVSAGGCGFRNDRMTGLKFKRRKVCAVRDFPPGCGTGRMVFIPKTAEDVKAAEDVIKVETSVKAEEEGLVGQRDDGKSCGEFPSGDVDLVENGSDVIMAEHVEVQSLSICMPDGDSVGGESSNSEQTVKVAGSMGKKNSVLESSGSDVSSSGTENMTRDIVVYADEECLGRDDLAQTEPLEIELSSDVAVPKPSLDSRRKKAKKGVAFHSALKLTRKIKKDYGEGSRMKKDFYSRQRVGRDVEDSPDHRIPRQSWMLNVGIPPSRPSGSSSGGDNTSREKVKETLRLFYGACRKLLQEEEAKPEKDRIKRFRVDFVASKILKSKGKYLNVGVHILGPVPGIEVGDEFQYRMELNILGMHKPSQGGIDYMKHGDDIVATSIVASGGYDDSLDNSDILIYTGQGGNVMQAKKSGQEYKPPKDQKLVQGNLALKNSSIKQTPVRVIRGNQKAALESSGGDKKGAHYVYDGLYLVEEYWRELGSHGKFVFKFKLRRMPGQPELSWKVVKNSKNLKYREGLCKLDISEGKERLPISAVNEIDDEKPPMFTYIVKLIYPDWCRPVPPKSCSCIGGCTDDAKNCNCVDKNGGEIPYNHDGAIVGAKPLIYECGPRCKCPASSYLRVTQHGIRFPLEIFKTKSRGWGVRSLKSIPSGSFICEYVGELLEDSEAERRTGNDEYLFDIGNRYENTLAEGMSELMPGAQAGPAEEEDEEASGFTIDAATKGNIGRFINHSCSPNLYAQNVLYDHADKRMPHVMFFAMDNIPPLQELTYHYNYAIDQVRDSMGNIKTKACYCGSAVCTHRLY